MKEWVRFFNSISLTINCKPTIWCNNQQTVSIVNKEQNCLHTKVKHVDIHQLWIQQGVQASRLDVAWVPMDQMLADGLTKALFKQKFDSFVHQLGLVDISNLLKNLKYDLGKDMNVFFPNSV